MPSIQWIYEKKLYCENQLTLMLKETVEKDREFDVYRYYTTPFHTTLCCVNLACGGCLHDFSFISQLRWNCVHFNQKDIVILDETFKLNDSIKRKKTEKFKCGFFRSALFIINMLSMWKRLWKRQCGKYWNWIANTVWLLEATN